MEIFRCVDSLAQDSTVAGIWVFGSCARSSNGLDSDVDLLVVREEESLVARIGLNDDRQISALKLSLPVEAFVVGRVILHERLAKLISIYRDHGDNGKRVYAWVACSIRL